jgi:hypothetical protein
MMNYEMSSFFQTLGKYKGISNLDINLYFNINLWFPENQFCKLKMAENSRLILWAIEFMSF